MLTSRDSLTATTSSAPVAAPPPRWCIAWMTVWIEAVVAFSAVTLVWRGVSDGLFNWVVFGSTDTPAEFSPAAVDHLAFAFGVQAAITIGWMVLLLFVVRTPLRRGESWAWRAMAASVGTWLVVDSIFSIAIGVPENALLNLVLALGLVPPLVASRP